MRKWKVPYGGPVVQKQNKLPHWSRLIFHEHLPLDLTCKQPKRVVLFKLLLASVKGSREESERGLDGSPWKI